MDPLREELEALKQQVAVLIHRVYLLEQEKLRSSQDAKAISSAQTELPEPVIQPAAPPALDPPPGTRLGPPPVRTVPTLRPTATLHSPSFFGAIDGSASMEKKIGQFWLNRVGIVAMLMGVSYFLKFAFENSWIGPAGRIAIGLLAGIGLVLWSEQFRNRGHVAFSYSLKAVGIGTLYLSLWGAFQVYHLIPASAAFVAMVIVTGTTIAMALSQNAQLLASFALIGGFSTPLLLSTGENHEAVLFSYVCLLDIALLAMAACKPWSRLLWGSFLGTLVLYVAWYAEYYNRPQRGLTIFFTAIFGALFAVVPLVIRREDLHHEERIPVILTFLPLLNATWFFFSLYLMHASETSTLTWYALVLAALYLAIANAVKRHASPQESNFVHLLHVAIAVAFLTIAIPAKLNAHWITIGWLVESAALLWVSVKAKTDFLRYLATAALILGITRLLFFDRIVRDTLIFNSRFFTYLVAIAVLAAIAYYGRQHASEQEMLFINAAVVSANLLALIALTWEASDYFNRQLHQGTEFNAGFYHEVSVARGFTFSAIWLVYGACLMAFGFQKRSPFARWQALILMALTTVKVFAVDVSELGGSYRIISFIALGAVLLAISFGYQRDWLKLTSGSPDGAKRVT